MRLWLQPCGGATRFYAVTFTAIVLCRMDRKSTLHRAVKPVKNLQVNAKQGGS